ncbi:MAG TPA: GrpB family protein, partial [Bacteroidales bacterium]
MKQDLNKLSVEALGKLFPIVLVEYDPEWKNLSNSEKQIIEGAIGVNKIIRIEHIGITAIPGLCAKPTIDILVEIKDETDTGLFIENLKKIGYHFIPKPENPPP